MKHFRDRLDPKYTKICIYAMVTALATFVLGIAIYNSAGIISHIGALMSSILKPLIYGGILCYLLSPVVGRIEELIGRAGVSKKLSRTLGVILSLLAVIAAILLILGFISAIVYRNVKDISIGHLIEQIRNMLESIQLDISKLTETLTDKITELGIPIGKIGGTITTVFSSVKDSVTTALFAVIFSVYFLLDGKNIAGYWKRALRIIAGKKTNDRLKVLADDADRVFSGYMRGQFIDALIVGVLSSVVLTIAGIPYGAVVGLLMGIGNLIPYVGVLIGYLSLVLVCLLDGSINKLIIGAICLVVIMFIDSQLINPRLLSSNVQVHPLLVVAALIGGGALSGFVGMLIAVPAAAFIKIQFDRYLERKSKAAREEKDGGESGT